MYEMPKLSIYPVLNGEVEESAFSANQNLKILD